MNTTPLLCAAEQGDSEALKWLLENNAKVDVEDSFGNPPHLNAARNGHFDIVRSLIEEAKVDVNEGGHYNWTVLHYAALSGELNVVKWLVEEANADVNVQNCNGWKPLHMTSSLEIFRGFAEERRVDLDERTGDGGTALHCAAEIGFLDIVIWLVKKKDLNVNEKSDNGETALHRAAEKLKSNVVGWLLNETNIAVNETRNDGCTALHCVVDGYDPEPIKFLESIKLLVEVGKANVHLRNRDGKTAYDIACDRASYQVYSDPEDDAANYYDPDSEWDLSRKRVRDYLEERQ
jgi:ankyrin repeat protein